MDFLNPELANLGSEPISASAPAGEPVRFDPQFEQLSNEIAKMESVSQSALNWGTVTELSTALLKSKSKDFRVGAYLTLGLFQTRGYEGLFNGLTLYRNLLKNFWETGFPEKSRLRGRIGAVQWLSERLPLALSRKTAAISDELSLQVEQCALEFVSTIDELFAADAPAFNDAMQVIRARADEVRAKQAAAEQAQQEEAKRAESVASGEVTDPADVDKALEECRTRLFRVAALLHQADPTAPFPYRVTRGTTWGWITVLPVHNEGVTYLPAPGPEVAQRYGQLLAAHDWLAVIRETEANFLDRVLAFDLQHHCAEAFDELGETYAAAKAAVLTELRGLLIRLPELLDLKFSDGVPMFSAPTARWAREEVLAGSGSVSSAPKVSQSNGIDGDLAQAVQEARRLSLAGELPKALAIFNAGIAATPQRRRRFLWRLELARLCMEAGKPRVALPQLTLLDEEVSRFSLEEWEPELSLGVLQQLFQCQQKLLSGLTERPPELENQLGKIYERLCRLDVNTALTVEF